MAGISVFEAKTVLTGKKRKRKEKGDPSDPEGYMGPWREYTDQVYHSILDIGPHPHVVACIYIQVQCMNVYYKTSFTYKRTPKEKVK